MKWKNGFYIDSEAPSDAVSITDEEYENLVKGQKLGYEIKDENGKPVLSGRIPTEEELTSFKSYLKQKETLVKYSQDIIQSICGENVPDIEKRKEEFFAIHNAIRAYEEKEPRTKV